MLIFDQVGIFVYDTQGEYVSRMPGGDWHARDDANKRYDNDMIRGSNVSVAK